MKYKDLLYFAWHIIRMNIRSNIRIPISIYIVLTNRCNNRCVYCRTHELPQEDILTTKNLKNIIAEIKNSGVRRIHLTGGEPMLRQDLGEIISYAKNLGLFVGMSTNGYQIAERIGQLANIDIVFLSYDGPPKIHAKLRGKNNVKEVHFALEALKKAGIRVWITTVLTKENVNAIGDIVDFAKQNNILANFNRLEFFSNSPSCLHPVINEIQDLKLDSYEEKKVFQKLIQMKSSGAAIGSSFAYLRNMVEWPYANQVISSTPSKKYKCWAGRAWGHLDFDGKLYPCGWEMLNNKLGVNVLDEGFMSAWDKLNYPENCRSCSHACGVENNLIFSLNISAVLNAFFQLRR